MPITAANRHRYPPNWKELRAAILERAGHRCEGCGVPNYAWRNKRTLEWTFDQWRTDVWAMEGDKVVRIVLTTAHLDHAPENNDPSNLKSYCQLCHNRYDQAHRKVNAYYTRRRKSNTPDLFDDLRA